MCYTFAMKTDVRVNVPLETQSFRRFLSILLGDRIAGFAMRMSFLLILLLLGIIVAFYWRLPPEIPLFYSRPWGVDQLAPSYFLLVVVSFLIMVFFVNIILASFAFKKEPLLSRIFFMGHSSGFVSCYLLGIAYSSSGDIIFYA